MLEGYEKFQIEDLNGKHHLIMEVNYSSDESVKDCKTIRLTYPDGKTAYIKKERLFSMLFIMGNRAEQAKIIPQKIRRSKWYETTVSVKTTRDIKAGESLTFPIKLTLPTVDQEIIADAKQQLVAEGKRTKSGIIIQ